MALFKFVDRIQRGEEIEVFGNGEMSRDFTYIDDLVEGISRLSRVVPAVTEPEPGQALIDSASPVAPWRVINIAGGQPVPLMRFITAIEEALGTAAKKKMLPMQAGDVTETVASPKLLVSLTGFRPSTPVEIGVQAFVEWYMEYSHVKL